MFFSFRVGFCGWFLCGYKFLEDYFFCGSGFPAAIDSSLRNRGWKAAPTNAISSVDSMPFK